MLPASRWPLVGVGTGVIGGEGLTMYLHPALGEALAMIDLVIPVFVALVLLIAILRGTRETCERAFRLLRWIANRPEPQGPGPEHT